jgi:DNA-binding NarL/FixJ family response regulator
MSIRVVLADDHKVVLHGLFQILERTGDIDVVALCHDAQEALDACRERRPNVVVFDVRMPGRSVFDVLREMRREHLATVPVILTAGLTDQQLVEALVNDVRGVVLKDSPPDTLIDCIRKVAKGGRWVEGDLDGKAAAEAQRRALAARLPENSLTPRELEIVRMVASGLRNKEIATRLTITEGTVKIHLHNVYEKLNVTGRVEMLLAAQTRGLL